MKKIILLSLAITSFSCQKRYDCVCNSISKNRDTLIARVNTTKIGSKGFKDDCMKNEKLFPDFVNCHLE